MNKATLDNDIEMITIIHIYIFIYVRYKIMYFQFHNNKFFNNKLYSAIYRALVTS